MNAYRNLAIRYARLVLARADLRFPHAKDEALQSAYDALKLRIEAARDVEADDEDWEIWDRIHGLEMRLIGLESERDLLERLPLLLEEHRLLVSAETHKALLVALPDFVALEESKRLVALRARVASLVEEVAYQYSALWCREDLRCVQRTRLFRLGVFMAVALALAGVAGCMWAETLPLCIQILLLITVVALAGAMGALTSTLQRNESVSWTGNPDLEMMFVEVERAAARNRIALGAVFASVFFLLLVGGLMRGALFPKFSDVADEPATWMQVASIGPGSLSKLIVWSFVAGFAERFVPSQLTRFTQEVAEKNK